MASLSLAGDTSGSITLSAPSVAGTNTITLPASTGTVLTTGSPQSGGVIQVVNGSTNVSNTTTSTTYVDTGLTATITPKFASSKILVIVDQTGCEKEAASMQLLLKLQRNGSDIVLMEQYGGAATSSVGFVNFGSCTISYLDSPATTSATTYKTQFCCSSAGRVYTQQAGGTSTITLMEISA